MIGTSDQSCWLAEACKILLLLHECDYSQTTYAICDAETLPVGTKGEDSVSAKAGSATETGCPAAAW